MSGYQHKIGNFVKKIEWLRKKSICCIASSHSGCKGWNKMKADKVL